MDFLNGIYLNEKSIAFYKLIDFVQERTLLKFDGTKSTVKHEQMALARVTCVRATGPKAGIPFIDDYISTKEHVSVKFELYSSILQYYFNIILELYSIILEL